MQNSVLPKVIDADLLQITQQNYNSPHFFIHLTPGCNRQQNFVQLTLMHIKSALIYTNQRNSKLRVSIDKTFGNKAQIYDKYRFDKQNADTKKPAHVSGFKINLM